MTARQEGYLLIALMICLSFVFQLRMKVFANKIGPLLAAPADSAWDWALRLVGAAFAWQTVLIGALAALLFLVWLLALTRLELSLALPLVSLALIINAIGAGIVLGEALSLIRVAGILIVAAGLVLVVRS